MEDIRKDSDAIHCCTEQQSRAKRSLGDVVKSDDVNNAAISAKREVLRKLALRLSNEKDKSEQKRLEQQIQNQTDVVAKLKKKSGRLLSLAEERLASLHFLVGLSLLSKSGIGCPQTRIRFLRAAIGDMQHGPLRSLYERELGVLLSSVEEEESINKDRCERLQDKAAPVPDQSGSHRGSAHRAHLIRVDDGQQRLQDQQVVGTCKAVCVLADEADVLKDVSPEGAGQLVAQKEQLIHLLNEINSDKRRHVDRDVINEKVGQVAERRRAIRESEKKYGLQPGSVESTSCLVTTTKALRRKLRRACHNGATKKSRRRSRRRSLTKKTGQKEQTTQPDEDMVYLEEYQMSQPIAESASTGTPTRPTASTRGTLVDETVTSETDLYEKEAEESATISEDAAELEKPAESHLKEKATDCSLDKLVADADDSSTPAASTVTTDKTVTREDVLENPIATEVDDESDDEDVEDVGGAHGGGNSPRCRGESDTNHSRHARGEC